MSIFLLVNNNSTINDRTPMKIYTSFDKALAGLFELDMKSVFKPIVLYEYTLIDGVGKFPVCFYRVKRDSKHLVEGHERIPINQSEFTKIHPFVFDKYESILDASVRGI